MSIARRTGTLFATPVARQTSEKANGGEVEKVEMLGQDMMAILGWR